MKTRSRLSVLSAKFRAGTITPEESTELDHLEAQEESAPQPKVRGLYDLPVFRACWEGDARDSRR